VRYAAQGSQGRVERWSMNSVCVGVLKRERGGKGVGEQGSFEERGVMGGRKIKTHLTPFSFKK